MEKYKKMIPYLLVNAADFYLLPLLIRDTGTAIVLMLGVMPFVFFFCSAFYGYRNAFHPLFAVFTAVLFAPSIFIFYNESAWVYVIGYGAAALVGNAAGFLLHRLIK